MRAARIRVVIEQIIGGLQGSYAAEAVAAAFASGAAAAAAAETAQEGTMGSFGSLSGDSSVFNYAPAKTSASSPASNMSKQFRYICCYDSIFFFRMIVANIAARIF